MAKSPTNFTSVLDRPSSEIDRTAKIPPVGSYICIVQGQPRIDKSSKKQTEFSEYTLKFQSALDDVDEDALETYLTSASGEKRKLSDCTIKATYYHTEASMGRLLTFLDHLDGVTPDKADEVEETPRQRMAEVAGKTIGIVVKHEPWQQGDGVSARVESTFIPE